VRDIPPRVPGDALPLREDRRGDRRCGADVGEMLREALLETLLDALRERVREGGGDALRERTLADDDLTSVSSTESDSESALSPTATASGSFAFLDDFSSCFFALSRHSRQSQGLPSSSESLEELEEPDDESDASSSLARSAASAMAAISGRSALSTANHFRDNFGRPRTVLGHTLSKFVGDAKFCVTAMVWSKLMTTCHQPPGTNTVSPGFCRISRGGYSARFQSGWKILG